MREAADAGGQHRLRNGQALQKLGIKGAQLPGSFLQNVFLVTGINVGDYHPAWRPEDACVMQSFASFGSPLPAAGLASQARAARHRCSPCRSRTTSAKCARC